MIGKRDCKNNSENIPKNRPATPAPVKRNLEGDGGGSGWGKPLPTEGYIDRDIDV